MKTGIYHDISNEDYHAGDGVSKSNLDLVAKNPALLEWIKKAPVDTEKLKALDMGTALHCALLEPDEFKKRFIIAPEFNRRTTVGKESEAAFLKDCEHTGKTVMDAEQGRKLELMRDSTMAHPAARWLLEAEGHCESSFYWTDPETGELCRCRPDRYLSNHPVIVDVKKVADMDRFARHIEEFRYHVQDAMYRDGFQQVTGETPGFIFLAVSETIDCGRYPVRVFELDAADVDEGHRLYRRDLNTYHQCRTTKDWGGVEKIQRPAWARKQDQYA
ncbi:PD-(D/E)XK nuclease-like domain-containing protein [Serratia marcescens]|uniref:PD-(D/E)XK nuclease-like domain-containing protein n=1 Tax=Serratia marcescens TaxID=615 RepID=UPI002FDA6A7F